MGEIIEKTKVVTAKKACELLGCKRTQFYKAYKPVITVFKAENGYNNLFLLSDVENLINKNKAKRKNVLHKDEIELVE